MIRTARHMVIPDIMQIRVRAPASAAAAPWWTVPGKTCVAAYQPLGADSLTDSYSNIANPGTYTAAPGIAPGFAPSTGWVWAGTNQYLTTGVVPAADGTWSMICRFSTAISDAVGRAVVGSSNGTDRFYLYPRRASVDDHIYGQGGQLITGARLQTATMAIAGYNCYLNGAADGTVSTAWSTSPAAALYIGCINNNGSPAAYWSGNIEALAIYSGTLTSAEIAALHTRINALSVDAPLGQYFDVSSVVDYDADVVTGTILTLTDGSSTAMLKYRDFEAGSWYALDQSITLPAAYSGTTRSIAIISDMHFGRVGSDSAACLTSAINDIDDVIGGCTHVFVLGDVCHDADEYDAYKTVRATSDIAAANWREAAGNHDYAVLAAFKSELGYSEAYHSLTIDNVTFLFLAPDSDNQTMSATQISWAEAQIAAAGSNIVILCSHQGRCATTRYTTQTTGFLQPDSSLESLLSLSSGILFCGHSHGYSGCGAPDATCAYINT